MLVIGGAGALHRCGCAAGVFSSSDGEHPLHLRDNCTARPKDALPAKVAIAQKCCSAFRTTYCISREHPPWLPNEISRKHTHTLSAKLPHRVEGMPLPLQNYRTHTAILPDILVVLQQVTLIMCCHLDRSNRTRRTGRKSGRKR